MSEPTFLLIGAQKGGTTWLHHMLKAHPQVFVPNRKELHFFNLKHNFDRGRAWYEAHFDSATTEIAVGESTPNYLWVCDAPQDDLQKWVQSGGYPLSFVHYPDLNRDIPQLVANYYPEVRLTAVLRNPVERAISSYLHQIRARRVSPRQSILDAGGSYGILGMGFYHAHLREWLEHFPADRFLILNYEKDIETNKASTLHRVFDHLGVMPDFGPDEIEIRHNVRSRGLALHVNYFAPEAAPLLKRIVPRFGKLDWPAVKVTPQERSLLQSLYEPDVSRLEKLLDRDLSHWRTDC